jgi:large subunit ribosomal protein L4
MSTITLHTPTGGNAGTVELPEHVFGIQPNVPVMHQVVTAQLAARRAGTQSTKTRAEVSGGGKKPFKQKGTGNARQGSTRSPQWSGGGVALGPKPRKYIQKTPKKMIALALRSALSDRANNGKVIVVDNWGWSSPKTKVAGATLASLGANGRVLIVADGHDDNAIKSFRNLVGVQVVTTNELNAYDVLCNDYIVFSRDTIPVGAPISRGRSTAAEIDASAEERSARTTIVAAPKKAAAPRKAVATAVAAAPKKAAAPKAAAPVALAETSAASTVSSSSTESSTESVGEATVTTTVTVRTIVDGVETVEVLERHVDHVDADTIHDDNPDAIETTVHVTEQTIVGGKVVSESESYSTEETES